MNEQLKIGDVVDLKSGGPRMTLGTFQSNGKWLAQWFTGEELRHGEFRTEQIELSKDE
jgi:uncharacterized protein YodC (DUF2158 family)